MNQSTRPQNTRSTLRIPWRPTRWRPYRPARKGHIGFSLLLAGVAALLGVQLVAQSATTLSVPIPTFLTNTGAPCSGCQLFSYAAGSTTPQATYSDKLLTTSLPNPIVMDSAGRPETSGQVETAIYLSPVAYKFVLEDASSNILWTQDYYQPAQNGIWPVVIGTNTTTAAGITLNNSASTDTKLIFQSAGTTEGGLWWNHSTGFFTLGNGTNADDALQVDPASGNTTIGGLLTVGSTALTPAAGTYTPTATSLTVTGSPTYAGTYFKVGALVYFIIQVNSNGGTTASTANTTYFSLPFTPTQNGTCTVTTTATANQGIGLITANFPRVFPPTWSASSATFVISGVFTTQ